MWNPMMEFCFYCNESWLFVEKYFLISNFFKNIQTSKIRYICFFMYVLVEACSFFAGIRAVKGLQNDDWRASTFRCKNLSIVIREMVVMRDQRQQLCMFTYYLLMVFARKLITLEQKRGEMKKYYGETCWCGKHWWSLHGS